MQRSTLLIENMSLPSQLQITPCVLTTNSTVDIEVNARQPVLRHAMAKRVEQKEKERDLEVLEPG